jgi:hypothetical protein
MQDVSRRHLLHWTVAGGTALAGVMLGRAPTARVAEASPGGQGKGLTLEVAPDLSTFDAVREVAPGDAVPTGPFYVEGPIFPKDTLNPDGTIPGGATPIGTFRC